MNQTPKQLARNIINADLIRWRLLITSKFQINLPAGIGGTDSRFSPESNTSGFIRFINKKPASIIEVNALMEGVYQHMPEAQRASAACSDKQKFIQLYPVLNPTLNPL